MDIIQLAIIAGVFAVGALGGFLVRKQLVEAKQQNIEEQARKLIENALSDAEQIKKEALLQTKDEEIRLRKEAEKEIKKLKADVLSEEKRLTQKSEQMNRKLDLLDKREMDLLNKKKSVDEEEKNILKHKQEVDNLVDQQRNKLEKKIGRAHV